MQESTMSVYTSAQTLPIAIKNYNCQSFSSASTITSVVSTDSNIQKPSVLVVFKDDNAQDSSNIASSLRRNGKRECSERFLNELTNEFAKLELQKDNLSSQFFADDDRLRMKVRRSALERKYGLSYPRDKLKRVCTGIPLTATVCNPTGKIAGKIAIHIFFVLAMMAATIASNIHHSSALNEV